MGGGISRVSNALQGDLTGKTVRIHGKSYTFQKRLGAGAFGAVYSARGGGGGNVAIKVIDLSRAGAGPTLSRSYLNEVQHLQKLRKRSHHVVNIYDFDFEFDTGRAYIVMELGGDNLGKAIIRSHAMTRGTHQPGTYVDPVLRQHAWKQLVTIVRTLTENNIVHMDLKPDNLILFGRTIKIADLGISKKADMVGEPGVGTPQFSAPEIMIDHGMLHQRYGPKADVWSLGAILYYMTYGRPPSYFGNPANPPPGQAPSRDRTLVDMLHRTLVRDPHRRADIRTVLQHPFTNR